MNGNKCHPVNVTINECHPVKYVVSTKKNDFQQKK